MKKFATVILSILTSALLLFGLAACGGNGNNGDGKTHYTVTFTGEGVETFTQSVEDGELVLEPKDPTRGEDYDFDGWFRDGAAEAYDFSTPVHEDFTLTAHWTQYTGETFTVTFTGEGVEEFTSTVRDGGLLAEPDEPDRPGFVFTGWFKEGATSPYDFDEPVTESFTLTAQWAAESDTGLLGEGTSSSPYLISSAADLVLFSDLVNDETEEYYKKWYRLTADIDLSDENYTPAGKKITGTEMRGFMGVFEGAGHTVTGLTINKFLRTGSGYYGLFGQTYFANISDLTVEFDISFGSYTDDVDFSVGGVVGEAVLTNFRNVKATGAFHANTLATNVVYLGGLAGMLDVSAHDGQSYIAYVENCYAEIRVEIVGEGEEDGGSLESAAVGGLLGHVYGLSGAAAIVNSATSGTVYGGAYTGGLAGSLDFDNVSIINCYSSANVRPSANEVSYAGGLVGISSGDNIIIDSVAKGAVTGKRGTSTQYQSYYGGIVGYAEKDDYGTDYGYYTPGTAVINCYSTGRLSGSGCERGVHGTREEAANITADFVKTTLRWDERCWDLENFVPTDKLASDLESSYTVTFVDGTTSEEQSFPCGEGYTLIGTLERPASENARIFVDWVYDEYEEARFYMPVVKDFTLTAKRENARQFVGVYEGMTTWGNDNSRDRGVIEFRDDGTLRWIESTVTMGTYKYLVDEEGEAHVFLFMPDDDYVGSYRGGTIIIDRYEVSMSVHYTFTYNPNITTIGEFFSEDGDYLVFSGAGRIDYQSDAIGGDSIRIEFTREGDTVTADLSSDIGRYFNSFVITVNDDGSITVNAEGKNSVPSLADVVFRPYLGADYEGEAFVKRYVSAYVNSSSSSSDFLVTNYYFFDFAADGTFTYNSGAYSGGLGSSLGRYFWFENKNILKITLDERVSTFHYDPEGDFFYGELSRGVSTSCYVVLISADGERLQTFTYQDRETLTVYVSGDRRFVVKDGVYDPDIVVSGEFTDGARVTVDGADYRVRIDADSIGKYNEYTALLLIGAEEGTYTYGGKSYTLDGIGNVTGDGTGTYYMYDDMIVLLLDSDEVFGFDYVAAKAAGGAVTTLETQDGLQGVWYASAEEEYEDENGDEQTRTVEKYYRYVIDGFGHVTIFYLREGVYTLNWGGKDWGTYIATPTGIDARYNAYNGASIVFYYEGNVVYTTSASGAIRVGATYVKDGYEGPTAPPVIPTEWEAVYTGQEAGGTNVVVNFRRDGTGTVKGLPFIGIYDGDKTVRFTAGGVSYTLVFDTQVTLSYGEENVVLTKGGAVTEVIPAGFAGTWTGTADGFGGSSTYTFVIGSEGSVNFNNGTSLSNVHWDANSFTLTGTGGGYEFTLTFSADEGGTYTLHAEWQDDEFRTWEGDFTKSV